MSTSIFCADSNTENDYKEYISNIRNRLIKEKHIYIKEDISDNRIKFHIKFKPPQWYIILDDEIKNDIIMNLETNFNREINKLLSEYSENV